MTPSMPPSVPRATTSAPQTVAGPVGAALSNALVPRTLSTAEMERSEKLRVLGEMASGVIHDINNMLGAILGRAQLVRAKTDISEIRRHVEHIEMVALQAGETVKRLLEYTRHGHRTDLQAVDLNDVVADAMQVTRHRWETQAQERGIFYTIDTQRGEDVTVSGIRSELVDAVANLILNAADAMSAGGPMHLSTVRHESVCRLIVADEGIGMTPDQIANVFSPFYTTKGDQGTGLGLAVVYGIVTRHCGEVKVDSTPGRGSRFTILIPYAPIVASLATSPDEIVDQSRRRVLLVDDDTTILDVIGEALREVGHDVLACNAGTAAIMAMEDGEFDVLVTDLGMPEVNGWDVARRARQLDPPLPVIVISGWGAQITKDQLEDAGVNVILPKPFRLEQIRLAIASIEPRRPA